VKNLQIPLNPPFPKGDFNTPPLKKGGRGDFLSPGLNPVGSLKFQDSSSWAYGPVTDEKSVGRASRPALLVAQASSLRTRTGKMPVPLKIFRTVFTATARHLLPNLNLEP